MNENPFDALRQLGQMNEQLKQVFGDDFINKLVQIPQSNFPGMNPAAFGLEGLNWAGMMKTSGWPRMDVYHTRSEVVVVAELPGLQQESDANLYVDSRQLTVSGQLPARYSHIEKDRFVLSEIRYGSFERVVDLPVPVRTDRARARYRHGLLEVRMIKDQNTQNEKKGQHVLILFE